MRDGGVVGKVGGRNGFGQCFAFEPVSGQLL